MGTDGDLPVLPPTPPPPRPAARRAAIDAAMRKFEGIEEAPAREAPARRPIWATVHRRPAGALVAAALIAVIAIPAIQLGLPEPPEQVTAEEQEPTPGPAIESRQPPPAAQPPELTARAAEAEPSRPEPAPASPAAATDEAGLAAPVAERKESPASRAPMFAPPAPATVAAAPPPPPPPPPPPVRAERQAGAQADEATVAGEIVVTGSRIDRPQLESAVPVSIIDDAYGAFLSRLQSAVRANDRRAVVSLVGLPLRVNFDGGSRTYRDRASIQRDFDRIFTKRVRQAILNQRANRLFINRQGAMVGDGEVWFDHNCPTASCAPAGRVSIKTINP